MEPKYVDELKDLHKGKDIYVICSGKSCDFVDSDFFDGKITVGVNQAYRRFKTTYLVRKENCHLSEVITGNPDTIHCITEGDCGGGNKKNLVTYMNDPSTHNQKVYFIKHSPNVATLILPKNKDNIVVSYSTTNTAIHLAAFLGAKNILLVGHDGGAINGELNFTGYYKGFKRVFGSNDQYNEWLKSIKSHTIKQKKWLKEQYNCNLYSINPFTSFCLDGNKFV